MNTNKHDTFLNSAVIAAGIVGLLLAVIDGPAPNAPTAAANALATAGIVMSERRA